jgi:integrase/recombinase XerD
MRYPFTLVKIKSKSGTIWHARFWNETVQKYNYSRSTGVQVEGKKEHRREAEEAARKIYEEQILAQNQPKTANSTTSPNQPAPQQTHTATAIANTPLIQYLEGFWSENSEYATYKRDVKDNALTPDYIQMNHDDIRRHVAPFPGFEGVTVGSLNKAILKKYMIWLAGRKTQRHKKDGTLIEGNKLSGRRANSILQTVRVAVRWAVDNEEIPADPFRKLGEVSENIKEKGILTFEERQKLADLPITDYRTRLVMLLGSLCGLRRGEIRGLQWGDILDGIIQVQHNYQDKEGLKMPKYNSVRKVPITSDVQKLLDTARQKAFHTSPESFILESPYKPGKPLCNNFFREGVTNELSKIGIDVTQQKNRVLTCHSLRHTFITLAQLSGISEVEVMALAGHKSMQVTKKYTHVPQVIDFEAARKKLETGRVNQQKDETLPKAANA